MNFKETKSIEIKQFAECHICKAVIVHPIDDPKALEAHLQWHQKIDDNIAFAENPVFG
jgi:hypothetical protein